MLKTCFSPLVYNSLFEEIYITPERKRFHEKEHGVICTSIGHNIFRVLVTIRIPELDNTLCLGFPGEIMVDNVRPTFDFTSRHDIKIDNQKVIGKHK